MQAWLDLRERCIVVEIASGPDQYTRLADMYGLPDQSVLRISVPIVSIKHVKTLREGDRHCLALRTRRPPRVTKSEAQHLIDLILKYDDKERQFYTTVDPSDCEAFGSPTAMFCLKFHSERAFRDTLDELRKFKLRMRPEPLIVAQVPQHTAPSHLLPETSSLKAVLSEISSEAQDDTFEVQYALESLLRHGLLRRNNVEVLLRMLLDLYRWRECDTPSSELHQLVELYPAVHQCNRGCEAFQRVCCH